MDTETVPPVPAAELAVGDRIAAGFLPCGEPAVVLFTTQYRLSVNHDPYVLVVYCADDGDPDDYHFLADKPIPLEARAEDRTGLLHSRADDADDPTPVSPARVPPHTGGMVGTVSAGQLVTDAESPGLIVGDTADEQRDNAYAAYERDEGVCLGAPAGFEGSCGQPGPHGPADHPMGGSR